MNSWIEKNNALEKVFTFNTFSEAIAWMGKAALVIDKLNHHPVWTNKYNTVHVCLSTHDAGNKITTKDFELAAALDAI